MKIIVSYFLFFVFFISNNSSAQIQIGFGTSTQNNAPINSYYGYNYSQQIYKSTEIGASGQISSISFYFSSGNSTNSTSWVVYLGHTAQETFSSTSNWISIGSLTEVFNGTVTFPATGNWLTINLTTPFNYNGTDNIVVAIDENTPGFGGSSSSYWQSSTSNNSVIYYRSDATNPNPSSPPSATGTSSTRANIILDGLTLPACQMPSDQPTNLSFSSVSSSGLSGSFTAASSSPSGNLIVRSTSSTLSSNPVDGINYSSGNSLGGGTVVQASNTTTFSESSLVSNTTYYYYVFSYNNTACSGGPLYNTSTPLTANVTTCLSGTPSTPTLANETTNSLNASWSAFTGATSYRLDLSTSSSFSSFVSGYQDLEVSGTTQLITGLNSNTQYYCRIRAHNGSCPSSNSSSANKTTLKIEPTNQATNFAAGSETTSNIPLSWTAAVTGSQVPDGYLIKGSSVSLAAIADPVDGTDNANSTSFSSGSANVKSSSTSYSSFSGYTPGTMYYYKIYTYSNATTSSTSSTTIDYKTDNVPTLFHATKPNSVGSLSFSPAVLSPSQATITWSLPSGFDASKHKVLVFVKSGSTVISATSLITDPTTFTANSIFGSGDAHSNDASAYCVYSGDGTSVSLTGLAGNTTYQVRILVGMLAANSNSTYTYSSGSTASGTTYKIEPTNQATNFAAGSVTTSNIPLSWTAAVTGSQAPDGYLIKGSSVSLAAIADPVDGIDNANSTSFSSGSANVKSSSTSYSSFSGYTPGTMYYYKIFTYSNATTSSTSSTTIDYKTDNVPTVSHATQPLAASSIAYAGVTNSSMQISWTNPSGFSSATHQILVFVKAGSSITSGSPTNNSSTYNANTIVGSGTQFQNDNNAYCIYNGDGTSVQISNLIANTNYHVLIYCLMQEANSNSNTTYSASLAGNKTTLCDPVSSFLLDFESLSSLPNCTSFLSSDQLGANINSTNPYQGSKCLGLQTLSTIYILPFINNSELNSHEINFYARTFSGTGQVGFGYLTDPSDANTFVNLQTFNLTTTYQLCNYIPQNIPSNIYIGIKLLSSSVLRVDNVSWAPIPSIIWSSQAWSNTTGPTSIDNATISDDLTLSGNLSCDDLLINSGYTLTVPSNSQLTVTGTLTNNGTLILQDGATFVQGTSGTSIAGSGTFTVEKALSGNSSTWSSTSGRYWYMGVPMVNVARSSFGSYGAGTNRVWSYAEATKLYTDITDNATTLSVGTGYVHRRSADGTLTFSATGANGLYGSDFSLTGLSRTAGVSAGYHLISNPYMAYIDWDAVIAANGTSNIESTYYIRSAEPSNNNALISYNSNGPNYVSGGVTSIDQVEDVQYIAPMQSIWVRVGTASATGSLAMSRSMLSHQSNNPGLKNTTIFPTSARVNIVDGARFDQMLVFMNQDMSNGVDQFDSEKMFVNGAPQIYTMAAGKKLVMNGLKNNKKKISVPLYLELPESKVYNLQLADYVLEDGLILLEDKQEGTIQDFSINAVYPFYANSGLLSNRFVLHFMAPDNGIGAQGPNNNWVAEETSYVEGGDILISSDSKGKVQVTLDQPLAENVTGMVQATDVNGKIVYSAPLEGAFTEFQMNVPSGIYYLSVQNGSIIQNKKVFVQN